MASISPYKDYELTDSLIELERLYFETKKEYDSLKDSLKYKGERINAILRRMESILSEKEEYKINIENYKASFNGNGIINFVERQLGTTDEKEVIEFILKTLGYPEKDSRYTKEYWESEIKKLREKFKEEK